METWSFNMIMNVEEADDFLFYPGFFEEAEYSILFKYKDYILTYGEILSATETVRAVELFLYFDTTYDYRDVFKDFAVDRYYNLAVKVYDKVFKVKAKLIHFGYPDDFDDNSRELYFEL